MIGSDEGAAGDAAQGEGGGRRRRGRRGGRRRRRGNTEGAALADDQAGDDLSDLGPDEQDAVANRSQPEFDFDDEEPAPATSRPAVTNRPAAVAPVTPVETPAPAAPTQDKPEAAAVAQVTPAAIPTAPVEVVAEARAEVAAVADSGDARAAIAETVKVEAQAGNEIVQAVQQDIATESPSVASTTVASTMNATEAPAAAPAPVEVAATPVAVSTEAVAEPASEPARAEHAEPTPAAQPATPSAPPRGTTGSLFFALDADTPPSVTRGLFEPVATPKPTAPETSTGIAHNDDEEQPVDPDHPENERSA